MKLQPCCRSHTAWQHGHRCQHSLRMSSSNSWSPASFGPSASFRERVDAYSAQLWPEWLQQHLGQKHILHCGHRTSASPAGATKRKPALWQLKLGHLHKRSSLRSSGVHNSTRLAKNRSHNGVPLIAPSICGTVTSQPQPGIGQQSSSELTRFSRILTSRYPPRQPRHIRWRQSNSIATSRRCVSRQSGQEKRSFASFAATSSSNSRCSRLAHASSSSGSSCTAAPPEATDGATLDVGAAAGTGAAV
mmetsp:Transcript_76365/g.221743  ORF Transcript_76365/g.221743 Transcript_76365/m.221743 type:complete len:247 (-) Transcript_76365:18-758(-)